jgi:4-amino-4-deoxy-L-arabinose transferase-like glycosyltransferase
VSSFSKKPVAAFSSLQHVSLDLLFLVPASLFFLTFRLGAGSLASWDEALYAAVAKEVVHTGDWLRFTLDGDPWTDKPPLAIWATALMFKLFGVNEFAARLFSALCGTGTVVATYFMGRQLVNRWTGFLAAIVLLSSSHFIRFTRFGMLDAPLTFFMTLAFFFFWLGHYRNRYLIFSGIAIGLGVMTKGLAAFFVFPVIWLYCLLSGRASLLTRSSYWVGVMIAAGIALPWHMYQLWTTHGVFLKDGVLKHLVTRTTTALDGHAGNWYFYIRTMINKFHPWILIAIFTAPYTLYRAVKEREDEAIFLSLWIFFILAVVSAMQTKLPWYILPIYPAVSITVAVALAKVLRESQMPWVCLAAFLGMFLHVPYSHIWDHDYSRDIKGIARSMPEMPAGTPLFLYKYHEAPAVSFYLGRRSGYIESPPEFAKQAAERNFYSLVHTKDLEELGPEIARQGLVKKASFEEFHLLSKD